ncbi:hypothetical protein N7481_001319 [Penicillium waksmanii]|uniref:uncharacterized protein n=1 Tax=Penicillium waksmanii TaxID=69791 RepID=UPI00254745B0|nr:uncharacterized protein N7481_001319 [Penicillium waksmanii]KAJ6000910.1 hypothetical protein N7481_001319 [Penicillium waksmanii]
MSSQAPQDYTSAQHFALIYIDQYGKIRHQVSPSLVHYRGTILSPQVTTEFLKAVAKSTQVGLQKPSLEFASTQLFPSHLVTYDSNDSWLPEDSKIEGHIAPMTSGYHYKPTQWPGTGKAGSAILKDELFHMESPCIQKHRLKLQEAVLSIKDTNFLRRYYEKVFQNIQQTNCRILAKAYVKLVEPQKQVHHPYNGRKLAGGELQQLSPEESKPPWWPPGVRHREPDHLLKAERIALLLHILCDLRCSHGITSQKLKNAEQTVRSQIIPVERLELLDELYRVRGEEEKFLDGLLDKDAYVLLSRINLPVPDEMSSKKGRPNSRVSSKYKQDTATHKSSSRNRVVYSMPMDLQHSFAGYTTGQQSMTSSSPASATPSAPLENNCSALEEACLSTAIVNPTELLSSDYANSPSWLTNFPVMECYVG